MIINNSKSFTIITAAHNSQAYIAVAIESVINQKYDKALIQHLIVDDGSLDDTKKIVKEYAKKYPHIQYVYKPNTNWGGVINFVKKNKLVKNEYVVILDSDDRFNKNIFKKINDIILKSPSQTLDLLVASLRFWNGRRLFAYLPTCWHIFKHHYEKKLLITPVSLPLEFFVKSSIFYQVDDLIEKIPYQDMVLIANYYRLAKNVTYTLTSSGDYWVNRPNNTTSIMFDQKSMKLHLQKALKISEYNQVDVLLWWLLINKTFRKYLIENDIKLTFKTKPDFSFFPFWLRWLAILIYKTKLQKCLSFSNKKIPSNKIKLLLKK